LANETGHGSANTWQEHRPPQIMSRPAIKVVAIDVDGTLLDGDHQLRDAVKDSLYELAARKIHVVLATARGPQALNPVLRPLQFSPFLVCFSGAWVGEIDRQSLATWKVILEKRHSLSVARSIVATALDHHVEPHVLTAETWRTRQMSPETMLECQLTECRPIITSDLLEDGVEPNKILLIASESDSSQTLHLIADSVQSESNAAFSKPNYLEIVPKGANKAAALTHLVTTLGLDLSQVAAIGDGYNDLEMIREAGLGIAMGNAPAAVQSAAKWVTGTNNETGVAQAVRRLVEDGLI
jgi:Cof subfamily protein (haloacid dehalogenase superfamily)